MTTLSLDSKFARLFGIAPRTVAQAAAADAEFDRLHVLSDGATRESDIDGLLGLSQYPGDPSIKPMVEGAPGHGEGHNSGLPLIIVAALAAKDVMEKNKIPTTI